MSSKREEERNEKIIRGLMKLPPNRKCINCNSLGPQYVCTNFWTFVCITCSGIHREFTHRVKSVSMSKFTSQEVEALQKGGNQRARESYLVHWDPHKQKQPNSSNAEKVREFIKHVYIDKKYAAGKTSDKPPRGLENLRHSEEETRRASSYHSYSQSPPYDNQYEERRYGKQLPVLTRKPGSDGGLYDGKVSNFSSPGRFSDQTLEHRLSNVGLHPSASDYSGSSPGQSPNFQRDGSVGSPPYQTTDNIARENSGMVLRTQRATSSGSFGSFDSNSLSFKSNNSVTLADLVSAPEQSAEILQDKQHTNSSLPHSSTSGNFGGLDLFDNCPAPQNVTPPPPIDLFQLPEAQSKAPIDLFEPSSTSSDPNVHAQKPSGTTPSTLNFSQMPQQPATMSKRSPDLFESSSTSSFPNVHAQKPSGTTLSALNFSEMPQQPHPATMSKRSPDAVIPENEGWATFDIPQHLPPNPQVVHSAPPALPPDLGYIEKVDPLPRPSTALHRAVLAHEPKSMHNLAHEPTIDNLALQPKSMHNLVNEPTLIHSQAHEPTSMHNLAREHASMHNLWHGEPYKSQVSFTSTQHSLDAFEDPTRQLSYSAMHQRAQEVPVQAPFTTMDQHLGDFNRVGFGKVDLEGRRSVSLPLQVEAHPHVIERKSSNPFDLSDNGDFESGNMYLNMTSLQAALPTDQFPNSFDQSWFAHNPAPHFIPTTQQGYMGGPAPNAQIPNIPTQGPVASVGGGNPFA